MISSAAWQRHKMKNRLATEELIRSLQQENRQLRQELEDANYRIRELEASQHTSRSLALFIPSASYDDSDNFSVEVQSVPSVPSEPSVTSSTTTAQMGSGVAQQKQQQQQQQQRKQQKLQQQQQQQQQQHQQRDNKETLERDATFHNKNQTSQIKLRRPFSKLTTVAGPMHRIPEIRRLFSSTSDLSSSSAGSIPAVSSASSTSSNDMINKTRSNTVSTYAKKYLLRAESTDSENSSESYLLGEV